MRPDELNEKVYVYGFSKRKRKILKSFVGNVLVNPVTACAHLHSTDTLMLWGSSSVPVDCPEDVRIVRLEDGFLRSVGLGADLITPVSWVMDRTGIYYDATHSSDLEQLLQTADFSEQLLKRAAALRERLVELCLTKYNVGSGDWHRPGGESPKRVILVPGQVESDASIRYGAPGIATNRGLLCAVRETHPDAYIVYKPHPDVVAGLRRSGKGENEADRYFNEMVTHVSMGVLLPLVDEVHTLTSLSGFEALLRGKKVICYGQPFYSGWGLTEDIIPPIRRTRNLTLDELVAGALLLYPTYVSRVTLRLATPEQILDELQSWRAEQGGNDTLWRKILRIFIRTITGVR